jgi:hypothetical protein
MAKLKLSAIPDDRPVKLTVELSASVHRAVDMSQSHLSEGMSRG